MTNDTENNNTIDNQNNTENFLNIGWHPCINGAPLDYEGQDWVLVRFRDISGFVGLPYVAEYSQKLKRWHFHDLYDEGFEPQNEYVQTLVAVAWKEIDMTQRILKAASWLCHDELNKLSENMLRATGVKLDNEYIENIVEKFDNRLELSIKEFA